LIDGINKTYTMDTRISIPQQWERFVPQVGNIPGLTGFRW